MRQRILVLAAAAFFASAGAAYAQFTGAEIVKAWDRNGDGVITKDEWIAAGRPADRFDVIDANHDGKITAEELDQALARMRNGHGDDAAPPATEVGAPTNGQPAAPPQTPGQRAPIGRPPVEKGPAPGAPPPTQAPPR